MGTCLLSIRIALRCLASLDPLVFSTFGALVQLGIVFQRGKLRAGCRFAIRAARTPEEIAEVKRGGVWDKLEIPVGIERERMFFPGLRQGDTSTAAPDGVDGVVCLPGKGAADFRSKDDSISPPSSEAVANGGSQGESGDDWGEEEVDEDNLWVKLQGWVRHDCDDEDVRFRPRRLCDEGAGAAGQVSSGHGVRPFFLYCCPCGCALWFLCHTPLASDVCIIRSVSYPTDGG